MKKFALLAATVLTMGTATLAPAALAAPYDRHDNRGNDNRNNNNNNNHGRFSYNGHQYDRQSGPSWNAPKSWHGQRFSRGQRLPSEYRRVEVNNYSAYHLRQPPRGYHYVRVGNDVVLAAIATGLISAVIANAFYN